MPWRQCWLRLRQCLQIHIGDYLCQIKDHATGKYDIYNENIYSMIQNKYSPFKHPCSFIESKWYQGVHHSCKHCGVAVFLTIHSSSIRRDLFLYNTDKSLLLYPIYVHKHIDNKLYNNEFNLLLHGLLSSSCQHGHVSYPEVCWNRNHTLFYLLSCCSQTK